MLALPLRPPQGLSVLALGAHPDDVELGCGGTILQLAAGPASSLHLVVLTGAPDRAAEAQASGRELLSGTDGSVRVLDLPDGRLPAHWLQVKEALEDIAGQVTPDVVLAPRIDDAHQDHRTLAEIVPTVFRSAMVLGYEIVKSDGDRGRCNVYVPLDADLVERKWRLLDRHFASQRSRQWWDRDVVAGLARLRGVEAQTRYAEGFTCGRSVLRIA